MFPFTIKYERKLNTCDIKSTHSYLDIIRKELNSLKIDEIKLENTKIDFKNKFFNGQGRWHLMSTIDGGYFQIDLQRCTLIYSYSIVRTFYITLIMSSLLGLVAYLISHSLMPWIFFFLWLFGMNWIISIIRHNNFINKLTKSLNT